MSARYVYDDAHGHRLTITAAAGDGYGRQYVALYVECMDIGGECANVWLSAGLASERLADALGERVPFEYTDHMGDMVTVAPAADWTTFTVVRAPREGDETPVTVRVVVLTARLPEVRAALAVHGISGSADVWSAPVGPEPRTLDMVENELAGASLSLYEEELDNARLRLALESARRGRARLRARVAELERAAEQIRFLHKDSPMGPCPVCVNADAGPDEDPTVPYPCPTARLAGAKDCDPPDRLTATFAPTQVLREDVYESPLHHDYRLGHDRPETGGAK